MSWSRRRQRQPLRAAITIAGLVGLVFSGCGGASDEDAVRETIDTYLEALADGDGETACSQLSGEGVRDLIAGVIRQLPEVGTIDCGEIVERLSGVMGEDERSLLRDAGIASVDVRGDRASVVLDGSARVPTLIKSDGEWLIAGGLSVP